MKRRPVLWLIALALGGLSFLAPAAASARVLPEQVQPACIIINGPQGLHIQFGYAPNGPVDCTVVPVG